MLAAVEILHQLAEGGVGQRSVVLLRDGDAGNAAVDVGIESRDGDAGRRDAFDQLGGIGARPAKNDAVIFLADSPVDEVTEACVVAVAEEGVHLEAQLASFLNSARQNCVVLSSDPRLRITAMRTGP